MHGIAREYAAALGRPVTYVDVPLQDWCDNELARPQFPPCVHDHLLTMVRHHAANRYDRNTGDVAPILGRPAQSLEEPIRSNLDWSALRGVSAWQTKPPQP
jgi:hypothetical protein